MCPQKHKVVQVPLYKVRFILLSDKETGLVGKRNNHFEKVSQYVIFILCLVLNFNTFDQA